MTFVKTMIGALLALAGASAFAAPLFDNTEQGQAECQEYTQGGNGPLYFPKARHRNYGKNHGSADKQMTLEQAFAAKGKKIGTRGVCLNAEVAGGRKWAAVPKDLKVWVNPQGEIVTIEFCDNPIYAIAVAECTTCGQQPVAAAPAPVAAAPAPAPVRLPEASLPTRVVLPEAQLPAAAPVRVVQPQRARIAFENLGAGTTQAYVSRTTNTTTTVTGTPVFFGGTNPTNPGGGTVTPIPGPRPVDPVTPVTPPVFGGGTNPTNPVTPTPTTPVFGGGTNPTIPAPQPIGSAPVITPTTPVFGGGTNVTIPAPQPIGQTTQTAQPSFGGGTNPVIYAGTPSSMPVVSTNGNTSTGSLPAPMVIIAGTPNANTFTGPAVVGNNASGGGFTIVNGNTNGTVPSFGGGTGRP